MDITEALAPASDQLDAVELVKPRTFTIDAGSALGERDGKTVAEIRLVGFARVWRPSKGMLDVLAACWGTDAKQWVGHRVTLYNDPDVTFGKEKVGGIRISHLSHIDGPRAVTIRGRGAGRKQQWPVNPLPDSQRTAPDDPSARVVGLMKVLGFDKARMLGFASDVFGREISSASDLTADEMAELADALEREIGEDR
jgi:hypothetical protein